MREAAACAGRPPVGEIAVLTVWFAMREGNGVRYKGSGRCS